MTAPAVPRETTRAPRPVAVLDDILLELVDIDDNIRDDIGDLDDEANERLNAYWSGELLMEPFEFALELDDWLVALVGRAE